MLDDQPPGMERDPLGKWPRSSVFPVAQDGKSGMRQLHPNLVLSPGERPHLQQRRRCCLSRSRNCFASRAAAFDVRASKTTPVTGASNRLTIPKYTFPGLLYFRRTYSFAAVSSDGRSSATPIVGSIAGLFTASK